MNDLQLGFNAPTKVSEETTSASRVNETRAMAEIQAAILMAKQDRRNENQCYMEILDSCKRPFLAEKALYAYPRGGTMVTGPSIRLAEVLAQKWSNLKVGITIIKQTVDQTESRAYAYDMQTNYMVDQEFVVPHKRTTKKGVQKLTDERDIRELCANIGSRILRGCILRVIPSDVVDAAIQQCKKTLESSEIPMVEQIRSMVKAFDELGVKVEHIEKRLGHNLDATIPTEIVSLKSIYRSIRDGMANREDFFDIASPKVAEAKADLKAIIEKNKKVEKEPEIDPETGEVIPGL
jgi:hypothetical protein